MPYGTTRSATGTLDTDKLFTGQRLDDTGLYFYNARYYDATIGRFISADTIVQDYTNPQTLNRYSYCVNNPLRYIDPSGHSWLDSIKNTIKNAWQGAWETVKGWSQAVRDTLDWILADKSASERGEDIKTQAKFYWENRDWVISSAANIGITLFGGYGVAAFGKSFLKGAVAKGARGGEAGAGTAVSTWSSRYTGAGETFYHYGYAKQAASFSGGLRAGGYATTEGGLTGAAATSRLALGHALSLDAVYAVTPKPGTFIWTNPVTSPKYGQPGGLPEIFFPLGTGPGTVSGPFPIP